MKKKDIILGLLFAIFLAIFISPFASSSPDGLEKVAEIKGFLHLGEEKTLLSSPIPDYIFPGIKNEKVATSIAGLLGTLLMFGITFGVAKLLKRKS